VARKIVKRKPAAAPPKKRQQNFKHIALPKEVYEELAKAVIKTKKGAGVTGKVSRAYEMLSMLEPGQSDITTLAPLSFNQARTKLSKDGRKFEIKTGTFFVPRSDGLPTIPATFVQRLA